MLGFLFRLVTTKLLLGLGLLATVLWQAYDILIPRENDVDLLRQTVAQMAIQKAVGQMPRENPARQIAVADLVGDRTGYTKYILAEELGKSDKFVIVTDTYVQRIIKEVLAVARKSGLVSRRLLEELEGGGITSLEAAIELANRMGVDGVLFGEVREFSSDADRARFEVHIRIADARAEKALFGGAFSQEIRRYSLSSSYLRARIQDASVGMRLFTWIIFTTLFPLVLSFILIQYFRQESNVINVLILVGLTVIDTLLALILMGFDAAGFLQQILMTLAFLGSLFYNYLACSRIERVIR